MKKSRFIARAGKMESKESLKQHIERMKVDYPNARHYCWAYVQGNPLCASSAAMNDDGEPSGTAGKPILNVIQHKKIGDIFVIVARYFGGIKLGAGGLVRAYAGVTETVLRELPQTEHINFLQYQLTMPFAKEQRVRQILLECQAEVLQVEYAQEVFMDVSVPESHEKCFLEYVSDNKIDFVKM